MKRIDTSADKIFFTSDMHYGNNSLSLFNNRPFENDLEMEKVLIDNWNKKVPIDGLVFVLGDIADTDENTLINIFEQLKGTKVLIMGNHEKQYKEETLKRIFSEIYHLHEIQIFDNVDPKFQKLVLCHYPMFDWNNFHEGSWHLFGHLHTRDIPEFQTLKARLFAQQYDVGVDGNNFSPISYYEIKTIIEQQVKEDIFKKSNYY